MGRRHLVLVLPLLLTLQACSDSSSTKKAEVKKEPTKPAEPVTGRYAFYQMYPAARTWASDIEPIRLASIPLADVKAEPGKAGAWEALFISPGKSRQRRYTYSIIEAEGNLHQGVFAGPEESYSGPRGQAKPFLIAAFKVDSDAAYDAAAKKSADYIKKNPDKPVHFLLELTNRFPNPAWRVIWGESVSTSGYSIFVDATTGDYLQTAR